jgi:hypothetical protein
VTYRFTVSNFGDADATNVNLEQLFDAELLAFDSGAGLLDADGLSWDIGDIAAGETVQFSYSARVADRLRPGQTSIDTTVSVSSFETDGDTSDNTEKLALLAEYYEDAGGGGGTYVKLTKDPEWEITKTAEALWTTVPGSVDYTIRVVNRGGPAYHAVLYDTLVDAKGKEVTTESWKLGDVAPNEEITITYTVEFATSTRGGEYVNYSQVQSIGRNPSLNPFYGYFADSAVASTSVSVVVPLVPPTVTLFITGTSTPETPTIVDTTVDTTPVRTHTDDVIRTFLPEHSGPVFNLLDGEQGGTHESSTLPQVPSERLAIARFEELGAVLVATTSLAAAAILALPKSLLNLFGSAQYLLSLVMLFLGYIQWRLFRSARNKDR